MHSRAHPRVGGENFLTDEAILVDAGSSPRGRGKRTRTRGPREGRRAHPRVGGENFVAVRVALGGFGSSPRGRGKLTCLVPSRCSIRLIPAWAGKTHPHAGQEANHRAHPRVGGENPSMIAFTVGAAGSSPRGRGKRSSLLATPTANRLIPAWAGKTLPMEQCPGTRRAHPRVGGENRWRGREGTWATGSSPRGRGKPRVG